METDRSAFCGCKGIRTCLKCEEHYSIGKPQLTLSQFQNCYSYCPHCNIAVHGTSLDHPNHTADSIPFPGVYIKLEFISREEESSLIQDLDSIPWDLSQSGRRKQNFGPKCNFKKRRLQLGDFNGFPETTRFVQERFSSIDILKGYQTIEQCSLEYDSKNGASIDPHIDDCWIWGERIVTVNLLSDSVLTLVPYRGESKRYNLDLAPAEYRSASVPDDVAVRVPMPRRSLLVLYGEARYAWEHMVLREDIVQRRVCLAYREFTPPYLPGGTEESKSEQVFEKAKLFW
uniref:Uncharacterized protein n=1 Tax=Homalodisca liturata TaxID=320908 RepID=A0A1B6IHI2_9HEMI